MSLMGHKQAWPLVVVMSVWSWNADIATPQKTSLIVGSSGTPLLGRPWKSMAVPSVPRSANMLLLMNSGGPTGGTILLRAYAVTSDLSTIGSERKHAPLY